MKETIINIVRVGELQDIIMLFTLSVMEKDVSVVEELDR